MFIARFSAVTFGLLICASAATAADKSPAIVSDPVYTHAQRRVEVESGRKLNLYCLGHGTPTVVFESGLTDETSTWGLVQPSIARKTRACSYDRAGVGFSDPGKRPSTSRNIADDLHRLLNAAAIEPPYILVGHSMGGMHMKLYAYLHPKEIAGLVFVDPSHEDQAEGYRKLDARHLSHAQWNQLLEPGLKTRRECAAAAPTGFVEGTELYKKCAFPPDPHYSAAINKVHTNIDMQPGFQRAQLSEEENLFSTNTEQLHGARRKLGDLPLIVLTEAPSAPRKSETQAVRDAKNELWLNLNKDVASLSSHGVDRVIPDAGHAIQFDQPQAVIDAILEVLAISRK